MRCHSLPNPAMRSVWRKLLTHRATRWLASGTLCAVYIWALWHISQQVSWEALRQAFQFLDARWLGATILLLACSQALRVVRWYRLLQWQAIPSLQPCIQALLGAQLINWLVPVRGGDVYRTWRMYRTRQHTLWWTAGSILLEKSLDSLVLAAFAAVLLLVPMPPALPSVAIRVLATMLIGVLGLGGLVALQPARWQAKLRARWPSLEVAHESTAQPLSTATNGEWLQVIALSAGIWTLGLTTNIALAHGFGLDISLPVHILLILALQLGVVLPSIPANLGVFPVICVGVLSSVGISDAVSIAYGSVLYVAVYGVIITLWIVSMLVPAVLHRR